MTVLPLRWSRIFLLALVVAALGPFGAPSSTPGATARTAPERVAPLPVCSSAAATGQTSIRTSDGALHRYYWRIPSTPAPTTGRPVLIWLHGDGGTGAAMARSFWPATDPDGAIIVTPDGTDRTWNHRAGDVPGTPYDSQFLSRIITQLRGCASVDKLRIFVGGVSRGAFMPYYLLMRSSTRDLIAGVAVNAGLVYCQDDDPECSETPDPVIHSSAARIIHLHGTNDTSVAPPPTATFHHPVNWDVDWRVFWPMKYWAIEHGCTTDDPDNPADDGVLRSTYQADGHTARVYDLSGHGAACAQYQLILVTNGGHVIDGQEKRIWTFLTAGERLGCGGRVATLVGTAGADTLQGTAGPDTIVGLGGNDTIKGLGGADRICGGDGADRIDARDGAKDALIDCGAGADPAAQVDAVDPVAISCG